LVIPVLLYVGNKKSRSVRLTVVSFEDILVFDVTAVSFEEILVFDVTAVASVISAHTEVLELPTVTQNS
jgi:hypothetical protein